MKISIRIYLKILVDNGKLMFMHQSCNGYRNFKPFLTVNVLTSLNECRRIHFEQTANAIFTLKITKYD